MTPIPTPDDLLDKVAAEFNNGLTSKPQIRPAVSLSHRKAVEAQLMEAIANEDLEKVEQALNQGARVDLFSTGQPNKPLIKDGVANALFHPSQALSAPPTKSVQIEYKVFVRESQTIAKDILRLKKSKNEPIVQAVLLNNLPLVKLLVQYGASVQAVHKNHLSLFDLTTLHDNFEMAEYLRGRGLKIEGSIQHLSNLSSECPRLMNWWLDSNLDITLPARYSHPVRIPVWMSMWASFAIETQTNTLIEKLPPLFEVESKDYKTDSRWNDFILGHWKGAIEKDNSKLLSCLAKNRWVPSLNSVWVRDKTENFSSKPNRFVSLFWYAVEKEAFECMDLLLKSKKIEDQVKQEIKTLGSDLFCFVSPTLKVVSYLENLGLDFNAPITRKVSENHSRNPRSQKLPEKDLNGGGFLHQKAYFLSKKLVDWVMKTHPVWWTEIDDNGETPIERLKSMAIGIPKKYNEAVMLEVYVQTKNLKKEVPKTKAHPKSQKVRL